MDDQQSGIYKKLLGDQADEAILAKTGHIFK